MLDLRVAVRQAMERTPGDRFEVGGLLLGSGDRIDALRPLTIEHRFGPSFWLSSTDIANWKQEIAAAPGPIGHFRSQRMDGSPLLEAAPQDIDHAIADLLNVPDPLLVLVPVVGNEPTEALVFRRTNGIWTPSTRPAVQAVPEAAALPARRPRSWTFPILAMTAAILLVVAALILWRRPAVPVAAAPVAAAPGPIGLVAHQTTGGISLGWNRESPLVRQSASGILTIRDGDARQQLTLNRSQLLDGAAVYVPRSGQVDFRLEVYRDSDHYSGESITVATGITTPAPTAIVAPAPQRSTPRVESRHVDIRLPAVVSSPQPAPPVIVPPVIAPPPQLSPGASAPANPLQALANTAPPLPPAPTPSPARPGVSVSFVAAVPVRKINPVIPEATRALLQNLMPRGQLTLDVKVQIAASGLVVNANPVDISSAAQRLIAPSAVQAARLWRFTPALRDGKPMTSDYVITFVFSRR
ncbi:MAG TPA: energy transducer TonB [Candidatus Sulfopaludibacter sp.]|nr:energy transducer TonB [Candidatus Sulfopaludibacter sp.]